MIGSILLILDLHQPGEPQLGLFQVAKRDQRKCPQTANPVCDVKSNSLLKAVPKEGPGVASPGSIDRLQVAASLAASASRNRPARLQAWHSRPFSSRSLSGLAPTRSNAHASRTSRT